MIDDCDIATVAQYKCCALKNGGTFYAVTKVRRADGSRTNLLMHRLILGLVPGDPKQDHIDGNGLNNRRSNLRPASTSQNGGNRKLGSNSHSGFKGVSRIGRGWRAVIQHDGRRKYLGTFATPEGAAAAYDAKAIELFGPFARTNAMLARENA